MTDRPSIRRRAVKAAVGAALVLTLGACSFDDTPGLNSGGFKDLKGITAEDPDRVVLVNNVDGFPNLVIVCKWGEGFVTSTREAAGAVEHVPALAGVCGGVS